MAGLSPSPAAGGSGCRGGLNSVGKPTLFYTTAESRVDTERRTIEDVSARSPGTLAENDTEQDPE